MHGGGELDQRWELYKVLADPQRLRLLAVAAAEELSIGELAELLGESQPNVSRQLGPLRRLGLLAERKQGTRVFVRASPAFRADPVVADAQSAGRSLCEADGVLARIPEVVERRDAAARAFFGRPAAGSTADAGVPAEWPAYLMALAPLLRSRRLAYDLGTGDGRLLEVLAPVFERVVAVDREPPQLERAGRRLRERGHDNVSLFEADAQDPSALARLRAEGRADAVFAARVLHHAPRPGAMIASMAGLVAPGGALIVLDYTPHHDEALREGQADLWLGFAPGELLGYAAAAGLQDACVTTVPNRFCGVGPDAHFDWQVLSARRAEETRARGQGRSSSTEIQND